MKALYVEKVPMLLEKHCPFVAARTGKVPSIVLYMLGNAGFWQTACVALMILPGAPAMPPKSQLS